MEAVSLTSFGLSSRSFDAFASELSRVVAEGGTVYVGVVGALDSKFGFGRIRARMLARSSPPALHRVLQPARSPNVASPSENSIVRAMLRHGFGEPEVYAPLPHERDVQVVLPVEDARIVRYFLNNLIRRNSWLVRVGISGAHLALRLGLFGKIVPHRYLFFTRGAGARDSGR